MNIFKEPIFHFLIVGLAVFFINDYFGNDGLGENEISVTSDDIFRIKTLYAQSWNRDPDVETLEKLIDQYVESEIYYKEALKLGLDHNDEIIKRRLKQKYEFLAQDIADIHDPTESQLLAYYNENTEKYTSPKSYSFYQYYINPDNYNNPLDEANKVFRNLKKRTPPFQIKQGDLSQLSTWQEHIDLSLIRRNFGIDFATSLSAIDEPGWHPPVASGFGYHVIFITDIIQPRVLTFEETKEAIEVDWKASNRENFAQRLIDGLRDNYKVSIENEN